MFPRSAPLDSEITIDDVDRLVVTHFHAPAICEDGQLGDGSNALHDVADGRAHGQVVTEFVSISPLSEFVLQTLAGSAGGLGNVTPAEVITLKGYVEEADLSQQLDTDDIDEALANLTGIPGLIWGVLWVLASIWVIVAVLHRLAFAKA